MFWTGVLVFAWIETWIMLPTWANGFWTPKNALWLLGCWGLVASQWWRPTVRAGMQSRWIAALMLWIITWFGWEVLRPQVWVPQTLDRAIRIPWVTSPILPTLTALGSLLAVDVLVRKSPSMAVWTRLAAGLCWLGSSLALYGLAQRVGLDPLQLGARSGTYHLTVTSPVTSFGNEMVTANVLAILLPLTAMFRDWRYGLLALLMGMCLLVIHSSISLAAGGLGLGLVWLLQRRWRWVIAATLIGLMVFLGCHALWVRLLDDGHRWQMWTTAWQLMREHPDVCWWGAGLGSVATLTTSGYWTYGFLHNEWLQIWFELGAVGLVCTLGGLWSGLRRLSWRRLDSPTCGWLGSGLAYLLVATGAFPLRLGPLLMLGVFIVSALWVAGDIGGTYVSP